MEQNGTKSPQGADAITGSGLALLVPDGRLEGLRDNVLIAIMRATLDKGPEIPIEILGHIRDVRTGIKQLLEWIKYSKSDQRTKLSKLRGLIDTLQKSGQLGQLLEQIQKAGETLESGEILSGYSSNTFLELMAADTESLKLLLEACAGNNELTQALLQIKGAIVRERPGEDTNNVTTFSSHGLLCAAAHFGNKEATALLLNAIGKSGMTAEVFAYGTFFEVFASVAQNGDAAALKKIVELSLELEHKNPDIKLPRGLCAAGAIIDRYGKSFGLQKQAGIIAVLLIGRNLMTGDLSNIAIAVESGDQAIVDFISSLLHENPELLRNVGEVLYGSFQLYRSYEDSEDSEYKVPESLDDFLKDLAEATASQKALCDFLLHVFPAKRRSSGVRALSTHVEIICDLPAECDHNCYEQLVKLMGFLDQMSQATGKGAEWARRLTILFNVVVKRKILKN